MYGWAYNAKIFFIKIMDDKLQISLKPLGITDRQFKIYSVLAEYGKLSVVQIAKYTGYSRPAIYRAIEQLKKKQLVDSISDGKRTIFAAGDPKILNQILNNKEEKLVKTRNILPDIINDIEKSKEKHQKESYVTFLHGIEGIKQVLWNTTKTQNNGEIFGYGYLSLYEIVGEKFSDLLHREYQNKNHNLYELTNQFETEIKWTKLTDYYLQKYKEKYIPKDIFPIEFDEYIYEDVVAFYHYKNGEYFGIEIHNAEIAKLQRNLYWEIWEKGEDMKPFEKFIPKRYVKL